MNISIKATNYQLTDGINTLINEKLGSCEKLLGDDAGTALFEIEIGKTTEKQHTGPIYRVEANVSAGGKLYRAEATAETMESAIEETREELQKEITRARGRARRYLKKGGAAIKSMLRFDK